MFRYVFFILNRGASFLSIITNPPTAPQVNSSEAVKIRREMDLRNKNKDSFLKSSVEKFSQKM